MRLDFTLLALAAPLAVLGDLHHSHRRSHNHSEIAKRAEGHVQLHKRFSGTRWTFYDVGGAPGACGKVNSPDQFIVALNSAQYGGGYPGPNCWKQIVMQIGDKQTTATITDECPGCPYGGLDLTRGLFEFFASLDVGVLTGDWWFADGPAPGPTPTTTAKPKPTPTPTPKPETSKAVTHDTPTTTSTSKKATSTSSSSSLHSSSHPSSAVSSSASSSTNFSSGTTSGLAVPTAAVSANTDTVQNILSCNQALINMAGLAVAGAEA